MALEYSTIGTKLYYAIEATAGSKPSSGWTEIQNIVSLAEDNGEPETIEVTNLVDTRHRVIPGLLGEADSYQVTANFTQAFQTTWESLCASAATAKASGKSTWFECVLPGHTKTWQFAGTPQTLGFPGANVAEAQQIVCYISKEQIDGWSTAISH